MIDRASIMAWNEFVPWTDFAMVEQDLIISRALVDIFSDVFLREQLAFRVRQEKVTEHAPEYVGRTLSLQKNNVIFSSSIRRVSQYRNLGMFLPIHIPFWRCRYL